MGDTKYVACLIILGALAVTSLAASIANSTPDPFVANWENLETKEKEDFMSYFLALGASGQRSTKKLVYSSKTGDMKEVVIPDGLGLTQEEVKRFQEMNIPDTSVQKLVEWVTSEFELGHADLLELAVKKEFCNDKFCLHILPDVNSMCCPW